MKLYIVRHGKTLWNQENRLQGWLDSPLSEEGIAGAKVLQEKIKHIPFDMVYSSDQGRAWETAKILVGNRHLPILQTEKLRELALGPWEDKIFEEVQEKDPIRFARYFDSPKDHDLPGVENFHDLIERVEAFLKEIPEEAENVLIVSHGVTILGMMFVMEKRSWEDFWVDPVPKGCSMTIVEKEKDEYRILEKGESVQGYSY